MFRNLSLSILILLSFATIIYCANSQIIDSSFQEDQFLITDSIGWEISTSSDPNTFLSFTKTSVCDNLSLFGGYQILGQQQTLRKLYNSLPPHYQLNISFDFYLIDFPEISPSSQVKIIIDSVELNAFNGIGISPEFQWLCGSDYPEKVWNFNRSFLHSSSDLVIEFIDNFTINDTGSWGFRNFILQINGACHSSCQTCSGPSNSDCLSCPNGSYSNTVGVCQDGISYCDEQINDNIENIFFSKETTFNEGNIIINFSSHFESTTLTSNCQDQIIYRTFTRSSDTSLAAFPALNIIQNVNKTLTYSLSLQEAQKLSRYQYSTIQNMVSSFSIYFIILIGDSNSFLRDIQFEVYVQITQVSTLTYLMDVTPQITSIDPIDPQSNPTDAIKTKSIVALTLTIVGKLCKDETCTTFQEDPNQKVSLTVGDSLYMKFNFVDTQYCIKNHLELNSVYFQNDQGNVTDLTPISEAIQKLDEKNCSQLILKTMTFEEALYATIQVTLQIASNEQITTLRGRVLTTNNDQSEKIESSNQLNKILQSFQAKVIVISKSAIVNGQTNDSDSTSQTQGSYKLFLFQFCWIFGILIVIV